MAFWIFMLCMDLLTPLVMICIGRSFRKNAPRDINMGYGYRTTMSMKNQDTWQFAHHFCGKCWLICGSVLIPITIVPLLFVLGKDKDTVGYVGGIVCLVQIAVLIGSVLPTEIALRKTFDKDGRRK